MLALNCYCSCLAILLLITSSLSTPEEDALKAVKQSLVDPKNVMSTWNTDIVNPCNSWLHIECNEKDQIKSISLGSESLSGSLSPDIGKLPKLQTLQLQGNNLSGSLPSHLGNLTNLETLNVGHNMFSGSIPEELGQLKRLQNLDLSYNQLSGAIPGSIVFLSSTLKSIDISSNNLSGEIPKVLLQIPQFNFTGNNLNCSLNSTENPCERNNSAPLPSTASGLSKSSSTGAIAGGLIGGVSLIAISIIVFTVRKRQIQSQGDSDIFVDVAGEDDLQITFGQLRRFSWHELQVATGNYSDHNILGQGGFGRVYRGTLEDGLEIAVKRLKHNHSVEGETAFLREVEMICVAVHRNLLQLIGVCTTPSERLLVYPFMVNGSVADRLRDLKPGERALDWPTRKHIALGAARGLAYLHDHCNPKIIHRDVKAANVLLDIDFEPVVGDFGLAKVVDVGNTHVTTMVRGTMGHIAPEYLATGKSSEKTDVFGYGVMLLELVTGQRAIDFSRLHDEDDVLLLDHVKRLQQEERISLIVDPNMHVYEEQEVAELIQVALLCTQPKPEDRPKMGEVVKMLAGEGLAERWEEWQQAEVFRRQEYERIPRRLAEFVEDSFANQEAIELSSAR